MDDLIRHIGYREIIDLVAKTNDLLFLSLPNIHDELSEVIISHKVKIKTIKIIVDNREDNFRQGYGEIKAVEKLRKSNIELYELPKNMVSFIISDDNGYYLFPQSRIFASEEDTKSNAVKINPIDLIKIKDYFFPPKSEDEKDKSKNELHVASSKFKEEVAKVFENIESGTEREFKLSLINKNNFEKIKKNLESNPPEHPDLKRKLQTYASKVQFVEIEFTGSNFKSKDIKIPSKALPYKDENLKKRLLTKMKLFEKLEEKENYKSYLKLNIDFKDLKEKYLKPITCRKDKNIIKTEDKSLFIEEINKLKSRILDVNNSLIKLLNEEIYNSKDVLKNELSIFLKANPSDEFKDYGTNLFGRALEDEVNKIIYKIKFPNPDDILKVLDIKYNFYDLTIEDFKDSQLLEEFSRRGILGIDNEAIVEIKQVFGVKK